MAKLGLVLNKDFSINRIDGNFRESEIYDYIVEIDNVYIKNGNGADRMTLSKVAKEINEVAFNNWRLSSDVQINFSWSGRNAELEITDPSGVIRKRVISSNPNSIFRDSPFSIDIAAIFSVFNEINKCIDWEYVDLIEERNNLNQEITALKEKLAIVEERITNY